MARGEDGLRRATVVVVNDDDDGIVYDSQEELDKWPDSQPVLEPEPEAIETVNQPTSSGKLHVLFRSALLFF